MNITQPCRRPPVRCARCGSDNVRITLVCTPGGPLGAVIDCVCMAADRLGIAIPGSPQKVICQDCGHTSVLTFHQ